MTLDSRLLKVIDGTPLRSGRGKAVGRIAVWGSEKKVSQPKALGPGIPAWSWKDAVKGDKAVVGFQGRAGKSWWVRPQFYGEEIAGEGSLGFLSLNDFSKARDALGQAVALAVDAKCDSLVIDLLQCSEEMVFGALVGMQLSLYDFRRIEEGKNHPLTGLKVLINGKPIAKALLDEAARLSSGVNLARHLTNLPPNVLNPVSFAAAVKGIFKGLAEVTVWGPDQLKKEKCGLILAVGAASESPPQLVHIRYRPKGSKAKPLAFVGKGITFDTGGLDLKPDTAMRLMKKDMGGSAAVAGLAWWVVNSGLDQPCDFYLSMAENAVGGSAFRPGDIISARSGMTVEIHNTDAEGRLVLADALDVAVEAKPEAVIDVATLTGAIKVGLGSHVAGLFGNRDSLLKELAFSCQTMGDWVWPMPLHRKYKGSLKSNVAELVNCGEGFGGAITAALFLEKFVGKVPWAHLDIYAWKDAPDGAISMAGGSGQAVQGLVGWLQSRGRQ